MELTKETKIKRLRYLRHCIKDVEFLLSHLLCIHYLDRYGTDLQFDIPELYDLRTVHSGAYWFSSLKELRKKERLDALNYLIKKFEKELEDEK